MATKTNQPTPSREYKELTARFEALCDEQERLYNPNFEAVFQALFQLDDEQLAIYNTGFWNMGALPSKPDEQLISQALKQAGFDGDSDFCKAFLRYASLIIEGKQVQQAGLIQNLKELPTDEQPTPSTAQRPIDVKGWKFKPMAIVAPVEFHKLIIETLFECANLTDIPTESIDEFLDELANREAFNVRCSLTPYIDALKRCRVILDNGSFFDREKTWLLFVALKKATDSMKANTDKPGKVKADIANLIKGFDGVPVWGLFFQILILQGLCDVFERLDINEGDTGYYEAQSLYNWIAQQLIDKEAVFCCLPYGENDLKRLEPICEYLLSTSVGQWVQACLFGSDEQPPLNPDEQPAPAQPDSGKKKGRPTKPFKDLMLNDEGGEHLKKIHALMNGKSGKDAGLIMLACIKKGWITKPTHTQVTKEFGDIGSKQGFSKYLTNESYFTKDELEGAMNSLN